ncbi:MAG TPA: S1/P1 nuclease [Bryobacteraceae bacterium]|jgi:hypothetical protein|nr:S1/P1 nuclease [Bryobacteraceae bacterium]
MQKGLGRAVSSVLLCVSLSVPASLWGWGNTGHEAVAYVAWQQLTPATKARVAALLKKVPAIKTTIPGYADWVKQLPAGLTPDEKSEYLFMRAATWPDSIKHHGLHDTDDPPKGVTDDVHVGFTDTASHGYWHFVDTSFASDKDMTPDAPAPNAATQIAALRTFLASDESDTLKAYDLIWLEHLVGDIHQPLHASDRYFNGTHDAGGNTIKVKMAIEMEHKFTCASARSDAPAELHAFWDDLPGQCPADSAYSDAIAFGKGAPLKNAEAVDDTDPSDWSKESFQMAQSDVYVDPIGPGLAPTDGTAKYVMTDAYHDQALKDAQARIALAGARLAKLLNENLK